MNKKIGFKHIFSKVFIGLMMFFFYLPIVYTVIFSFNSSKSLSKFTGFSFIWYERLFKSNDMMDSIFYTVVIAVLATFISTIVGTITAIGLSKSNKVLRGIVAQINDLPVMNPDIVTAIGLLMFFSSLAIKKGFITLLLAHIMFCIPFVILSVLPKLRSLDPNILDAALDLGCTPSKALIKVIVPQITSGILAGALIAFTMSFDDFVISYFVTGNGVNNISIMIYTMTKRVNPTINVISTLIIAVITIILVIINIAPIIKERKLKMEVKKNEKTS